MTNIRHTESPPDDNPAAGKAGTSAILSGLLAELKAETARVLRNEAVRELGATVLQKIPVYGDYLEVMQKVRNTVTALETDRRCQRLEAYMLGLSACYEEELSLQSEDFHAVLRRLLQDDESDKTALYTRLTISLSRSDMPRDNRLHFIRLVSELSRSQTEFARAFYLRQTVPLKGYLSTEEAVRELTDREEGMTQRAISALVSRGLLREQRNATLLYEGTDDLGTLMELVYSAEERLPQATGNAAKDTPDVIIIRHIRSAEDLYIVHLSAAMRARGLSVEVVERNSDHRKMKQARCYIFNNRSTVHDRGREQKYINVYVLQHPDADTLKLTHPDRAFDMEEDLFLGTGRLQADAPAQVRKLLDNVAGWVVQVYHENARQS